MPVAVVVFARAPQPGAVKTRLIPALGAGGASELHEALVRRTVATCLTAGVGPVYLACTPTTDAPLFADLACDGRVQVMLQRGSDLGERMHCALSDAMDSDPSSLDGALVVGCDIPSLETLDLLSAARWLGADGWGAEQVDEARREDERKAAVHAVVGPAMDGGYYLIGLREPERSLFEGVEWGTDSVIATTRRKLDELGWRWRELIPRRDIDTPEDLDTLSGGECALFSVKRH